MTTVMVMFRCCGNLSVIIRYGFSAAFVLNGCKPWLIQRFALTILSVSLAEYNSNPRFHRKCIIVTKTLNIHQIEHPFINNPEGAIPSLLPGGKKLDSTFCGATSMVDIDTPLSRQGGGHVLTVLGICVHRGMWSSKS